MEIPVTRFTQVHAQGYDVTVKHGLETKLPRGAQPIDMYLAVIPADLLIDKSAVDARTTDNPNGYQRQAVPSGLQIIDISIDDTGLHLSSNQPGATRSGHSAGADDVALQLSSSGTTGRPKRVPLRHRNMLASVEHIVDHYQLNGDDRTLCVMAGMVAAARLYSQYATCKPRNTRALAIFIRTNRRAS